LCGKPTRRDGAIGAFNVDASTNGGGGAATFRGEQVALLRRMLFEIIGERNDPGSLSMTKHDTLITENGVDMHDTVRFLSEACTDVLPVGRS
jgi:hypothetical protein